MNFSFQKGDLAKINDPSWHVDGLVRLIRKSETYQDCWIVEQVSGKPFSNWVIIHKDCFILEKADGSLWNEHFVVRVHTSGFRHAIFNRTHLELVNLAIDFDVDPHAELSGT